jgi:D-tyrosyl-tRNA(Tyr) deacylase
VRALVQRVRNASVRVDQAEISRVGPGLLILLGVRAGEGSAPAARLAERCASLRIFEDPEGKMNRSVRDIGGAALVVPQFTLYADTSSGRRPGFEGAARPEEAEPAYERFCEALASEGVPVSRGQFGATMDVELLNQGPATFLLQSPEG